MRPSPAYELEGRPGFEWVSCAKKARDPPAAGLQRGADRGLLDPSARGVGLREDSARMQGLQFVVNHKDASDWYASRRIGNRFPSYKVLVEKETDRILGAHFFGPHADDVINLFALATHAGVKAIDVRHVLYAYPSVSGDISYMV